MIDLFYIPLSMSTIIRIPDIQVRSRFTHFLENYRLIGILRKGVDQILVSVDAYIR